MNIPWHYAYSVSDLYAIITVYVCGPFIKLEQHNHGEYQVRKLYLDLNGKSYKTEAAIESHVTRQAKKPL